MERVDNLHERLHCRDGLGLHPVDLVPQQAEVAELRDGHLGQCRLVVDGRRQRGIIGKLEERHQRRVGEQAKQVDHAVGGSLRIVAVQGGLPGFAVGGSLRILAVGGRPVVRAAVRNKPLSLPQPNNRGGRRP